MKTEWPGPHFLATISAGLVEALYARSHSFCAMLMSEPRTWSGHAAFLPYRGTY